MAGRGFGLRLNFGIYCSSPTVRPINLSPPLLKNDSFSNFADIREPRTGAEQEEVKEAKGGVKKQLTTCDMQFTSEARFDVSFTA